MHIFILLCVSGIIAYLGDALGTFVGKRRLTFMGFRPRVTALLVAISTGILITLFTLLVAAIFSENVRIALFSVQQLRDRLAEETKELERERDKLIGDLNDLQNTLKIKEQSLVVYRKDEPLAARVIDGGKPANEVMKDLTGFIISLAEKVRERGLKVQDEISFFKENQESLAGMAAHISSSTQELVVAAVATENINVGEHLGKVRFILRPNNLIFSANEEIASVEIDGSMNRGVIAQILRAFMDEINHEVVKLGMVGDPLTGRFGDLSSESMLSFYDIVTQIKTIDKKVVLVAVVQEDTYAIGPLNFFIRLENLTEDEPERIPDNEGVKASDTDSGASDEN